MYGRERELYGQVMRSRVMLCFGKGNELSGIGTVQCSVALEE